MLGEKTESYLRIEHVSKSSWPVHRISGLRQIHQLPWTVDQRVWPGETLQRFAIGNDDLPAAPTNR
jgi:hypothetical protein